MILRCFCKGKRRTDGEDSVVGPVDVDASLGTAGATGDNVGDLE
jgi:hypothetical protein